VRERRSRGLGRFGMATSERVVDHRRHVTDSTSLSEALAAYTGARPDVQALVPRTARRVLDLGCATGALGAALRHRQGAEVVGVELNPAHAREAARRLDRVVEADVEALAEAAGDLGRFDCIVAADVLEHLRDPWATLARLTSDLLEPGGTVVVSLPNVRFFETFWQLGVRGRWPQQPDGIFDRTHLRWFTGRDAVDLMAEAGLALEAVHRVHRLRPSRVSPWDARVGRVAERTPLRPFLTFQVVLRARRPPAPA